MEDFKDVLDRFALAIISDIQENMSYYGMQNSKLADSLDYTIDDNGIKIYAASYFPYAEKGRGPGGVPYNFEDIIKQWVSDRGISVSDVDKFAVAVKWKTINEGSSLYRNPSEQRDFIADAVDNNIDILKNQLSVFISSKV